MATESKTSVETKKKDSYGIDTWIDPWVKAMQSWSNQAQKLQQSTLEGMTRVLDNGHALAKQGIGIAADVTSTVQREAKAQLDRTVGFVNSFVQR